MYRWIWLILAGAIALSQTSIGLCGSLIHKSYIVRYDRGWDILCEPYVINANDSVLKIFHQKGEISRQDYGDFLDIFKRLNPHIRNVDLVRPGQRIDIPLRKLEHGTLPGQTSGVITITFATLHDVTKIIRQHSNPYTVQKGDMVSMLIAREHGRYGSQPYREGIQLFKAANPEVTTLELIYVGQVVNIPDAAIRKEPWYANLFDNRGHLRKKVHQNPPRPPMESKPVSEPQIHKTIDKFSEKTTDNLMMAADCVGGRLKARGTYFLPIKDAEAFELKLLKHPLLEFDAGPKLVFTTDHMIMDLDKDKFQTYWPEITPVTVGLGASTEQYIAAIFAALNENGGGPTEELTIKKPGVRITVRAKYIRTEEAGRQLCITPVASAVQQTPGVLRRYLERNGIVIREIVAGRTIMVSNHDDPKIPKVRTPSSINPSSQKDFVRQLSHRLGFSYIPNTNITFPYAGFQVEAYGNLLSAKPGREILIDFSELYGDAATAIKKTGLDVVQIGPRDSYNIIAQKILTALSIQYKQHLTLLAARRSAKYNTAITINGLAYTDDQNRRILLTSADLHSAVTELLNYRGIDVVAW
jgi:LysM repeat protein